MSDFLVPVSSITSHRKMISHMVLNAVSSKDDLLDEIVARSTAAHKGFFDCRMVIEGIELPLDAFADTLEAQFDAIVERAIAKKASAEVDAAVQNLRVTLAAMQSALEDKLVTFFPEYEREDY